jgi:Tol biopolymer transport system component
MADLVERLNTALGGRYRVDAKLGEGGMGFVFLADDLKHGRKVALKVLRPELAESIGAERFLREIRITAQLNHPNILTLIDSGGADGFMYYVLPYVEGESLRDRLNREGQLPIEDAVRITWEIADALAYAHDHGIVHRDIKPENILLESGHAVVADFGIAHAVSEAGGEKLTGSGLALGTPAYMSPEQATASEHVDGRSDVYSLACVLYEMLAGAPPFTGTTPFAILARKAVESVPGLRVVRDTVPPAVEAVVLRALARVPADRYTGAAAFAAALKNPSEATGKEPRRLGAFLRGRWTATASAIVVVAAAAYVMLAITQHDSASDLTGATFTRITVGPGVEWFPSFSPDGQWLVFSGEMSGNRDIYLQSVGGQNAIDLTPDSPVADDQPAFSPDGERIAFRSERDGGGIFVMGRTGEGPRRVTRRGFRPSWNPDGTQIAFATENVDLNPQNSNNRGELWVADVESGETRRVTEMDASMPAWSPRGQRIAFFNRLDQTAGGHVWTVPAGGGEAVRATEGGGRDWSPAWSPDGRYLWFVSDRGGSMNLWRERIDEESGRVLGEPEAVTAPGTSLAHVTLAPDGRHIAYSSVLVTSNVQRSAFDPVAGRMRGDPEWLTRGSRRWANPAPSPDGRDVVFYSLVEPEGDLYMMPADGSAPPRQLTRDASDRVPRWSPDGKWIAVFSDRRGPLQVWKIHPDGSGLTQVTDEPGGTAYPVWSPEGSRMVVANPGGADPRTFLFHPDRPWGEQNPDTLPPLPDSPAGFAPNSWSPDGARLAGQFAALDRGVVIYTFATRKYEQLTDFGQWPVWLPDSRRILFVSGGSAFYVVDAETKAVQRVFSVDRDVVGPPQITVDGKSIYYTRRVTEADLYLMSLR